MDQAKKGADALAAGKYDDAVKHYTDALKANPTAVNYFIQRSIAHARTSPPDHKASLDDAEHAVSLAYKRANRELIGKSQFRRGVALFNLERYGDAAYVFGIVKEKDPKDNSLPIWEMKVNKKLKELGEGHERAAVTVKEIPEVKEQPAAEAKGKENAPSATASAPTTPSVVQTPVDKIKHEWYQNNEFVFFTLLAKGVPKDKATIDIQNKSLSISFPTANGSTYDFSLDPLFAPIDPAESTSRILGTKIEIKLKKEAVGLKWKELEGDENADTDGALQTSSVNVATKPAAAAPSYPTSSKSGPKDWDKLAQDLTAKKGGEQDDLDDVEGDPANHFFQQLYKNADPDTRRAMIKSYTESGGTALSTDWSQVGKKTTEITPPEGMVAKKWGE